MNCFPFKYAVSLWKYHVSSPMLNLYLRCFRKIRPSLWSKDGWTWQKTGVSKLHNHAKTVSDQVNTVLDKGLRWTLNCPYQSCTDCPPKSIFGDLLLPAGKRKLFCAPCYFFSSIGSIYFCTLEFNFILHCDRRMRCHRAPLLDIILRLGGMQLCSAMHRCYPVKLS